MAHPELPQSALALIVSGRDRLLQLRPDLPGRLPYPGQVHFFGGGVEQGEAPEQAVIRELCGGEKEGGSVVQLPRSIEGIEALARGNMTLFAAKALLSYSARV